MRQNKQARIEELEQALATKQAGIQSIAKENEFLLKKIEAQTKRIAEIAAENESLRMDKKWLQQMHSALLQSIPEMFRSRNAISR